jgi:hypothetical protein
MIYDVLAVFPARKYARYNGETTDRRLHPSHSSFLIPHSFCIVSAFRFHLQNDQHARLDQLVFHQH